MNRIHKKCRLNDNCREAEFARGDEDLGVKTQERTKTAGGPGKP
jgi:hypothetical protein